ncbi:hypothetical protein HG15A2_23390 [Adhaeretor mobilis]|uniref:Uncharacterized protein n=1 Tax=Adhaeretor mobilis TaxID=1930276 RepID=A0A517MW05_9BACT|nr:hypothetical protein HG15A2_23390 [Adhaeretor mobilis]
MDRRKFFDSFAKYELAVYGGERGSLNVSASH